MKMHSPIHPGEILREMYLSPLALSVTEAAGSLGVTRKALSELLNGKAGISTIMALRLAKAFNTTPEYWLTMQQHYDLWRVQKKAGLDKVRVLVEA